MKRKTSTTLAIGALCAVIVSLAVAGCGGTGKQKESNLETTFTEADNGRTVQVKTGDVIRVQLPENPSTGYHWAGTLTGGLQLLRKFYTPDDASGQAVGSGGVVTWTMQVDSPGEHRFIASDMPPGKTTAAEPKRFMLTIEAQ
jgi:inhibitor of cysteine peptidase